jgi:hypothetical protein
MKGKDTTALFADCSGVIESFGNLMEQRDDYPRRYREREFPDAKMIDGIGSGELGKSKAMACGGDFHGIRSIMMCPSW